MESEKWLARPLREVIREVAVAVTEGQAQLDRSTVAIQRDIERAIREGELSVDLDAPWYRFSEVETNVKLALEIEGEQVRDDEGTVRAYRPVMTALPAGPRLKETYDIDAEMTSEVTATLVPVPTERVEPEGSGDER